MLYVTAVSAMVKLDPEEILWKLPLSDGLFYRAEKWRQDGLILRRQGRSDVLEASKFLG